jgi:hypothetical protein
MLFLSGAVGFVVCNYLAPGFHRGTIANVSGALAAILVAVVVFSIYRFKSDSSKNVL